MIRENRFKRPYDAHNRNPGGCVKLSVSNVKHF